MKRANQQTQPIEDDASVMTRRERSMNAKRKRSALALWTLLPFFVGATLFFGYKTFSTLEGYLSSRNAYSSIEQDAGADANDFTGVIDFAALRKINPDIEGWLYLKDSVINYPVVKGSDNAKYLHTLFNGKKGSAGTLFCDARGSGDFEDFNTIVYGHHMKDGSMFKTLSKYVRDKNFYDGHKRFELITPQNKYHLDVFTAYITRADGGTYKLSYPDSAARADYLELVTSKSVLDADVQVSEGDKIITLSTCAYDFKDARYVVIAKATPWSESEIQAGERLQRKLDAQKAQK